MLLQYGDEDGLILTVQKRLKELGYPVRDITGGMDSETAVAIIHYKRASGIFPNNTQLTPETLQKLHINEQGGN